MTEKVLIAEIVAAHGIRGDVKVKSHANPPENIKGYSLFNEKGEAVKIKFKSQNENILISYIDGVNSRNDAELLKGKKLYMDRAAMPKLKQEEHYQADLIGLTAIENGKNLGKVLALHNFGSGDILEIGEGKSSFMLMFTKSNVKKIDAAAKTIEISRPEEV